MRRKEREIQGTENVEAVLAQAKVLRLGMCVDNRPYVVPLSFGYADGRIYFHSGPAGRKLETLRANPAVCFEAEAGVEIIAAAKACDYSARYRSVIGFGRAVFVEDEAEKLAGLRAVMAQYSKGDWDFPAAIVARTTVVRIDIESMTGKQAHQPA
jgi:nitroimidazol reductase NimA-like FMN-containing flavoprotein (pyridoxamine 5'-phosphate oxidase superfamily)